MEDSHDREATHAAGAELYHRFCIIGSSDSLDDFLLSPLDKLPKLAPLPGTRQANLHMKAQFLNVDLEIESVSKLDSLVKAMGKKVWVLYSGRGKKKRHFVSLECSSSHKGPDATIHGLCAIIESLPPAAKRVWDVAARKEFDIGYELRPSERVSHFALRTKTLERIAGVGATLAVTYYRGGLRGLSK